MDATIVTILALLFLSFVALGIYATVKVAKAAKRGVDRTIDQARRTVEDTTLRAKSLGQIGVAAELAKLRLALRGSMRATQEALQAGAVEDASLRESLDLFARLSAHGRELDEDLRRMEREPDKAYVAAQLPALTERTERITGSADALRQAARDRARRFAEDDLETLSAQIDMETGALRHWTTDDRTTTGTSGRTGASQDAWYESAPGAPGQGPGQPQAGDGPQAITAPDHRTTAYPWEKTARPESAG
ncbi:hypothetical protein ACFFSH_01905 [Streptomyces filamentosus]|uniref:Secreted protein n=1 Tax=Streptomyces filamentosus TaxID=67294 RepID=A0A919BMG1_STRFL|nr:hypothetical protein [Streptomyces filamentosus]GHG01167.1 hypothetical protein GCM10017667_35830 [Streptomyces filamentosus]